MTPEGFFNASEGGARHLNLVRGLEALSVDDRVYDALFRPDLVREALAGGLVKSLDPVLALDPFDNFGHPACAVGFSPCGRTDIVGLQAMARPVFRLGHPLPVPMRFRCSAALRGGAVRRRLSPPSRLTSPAAACL